LHESDPGLLRDVFGYPAIRDVLRRESHERDVAGIDQRTEGRFIPVAQRSEELRLVLVSGVRGC